MIACFDVGGTSIKYAVVDKGGALEHQGSFTFEDKADVIFDAIAAKVEEMRRAFTIEGIGVAAPGAVRPDGVIGGLSALKSIHGPNWLEELGSRCGLPVSIENDANCAALAESHLGCARGLDDVAFVVIGSGIGGTLLHKGEILRGAHGYAGEFGYAIFNQGEAGCQTYSELAATEALSRAIRKAKGDEALTGKDAFELAQGGDEAAQRLVREFYAQNAIGIYNLQYIYDPDAMVLGGAVTRQDDFAERLGEALDAVMEQTGNRYITPRLELCQFGPEANLVGAYVHHCMTYGREYEG